MRVVTAQPTSEAPPRDVVALTTRAVPIRLRGLSAVFRSSQLAKLDENLEAKGHTFFALGAAVRARLAPGGRIRGSRS